MALKRKAGSSAASSARSSAGSSVGRAKKLAKAASTCASSRASSRSAVTERAEDIEKQRKALPRGVCICDLCKETSEATHGLLGFAIFVPSS